LKKGVVLVLAMAVSMMLFAVPVMATPKDSSPAWNTYPATDTYYEVTYAQLTQMCLDEGLSENPYPAPLTPTVVYDLNTFVLTVTGASDYYIFTITIGDGVYPGVACGIHDMTLNYLTGALHEVVQSVHYFGDLGEMNHGFKGVVTVDMQGHFVPATNPNDLPIYVPDGFTASWAMKGFGRFTGQTLTLTQDSAVSWITAAGSCLVLGNKWYK
jgi:hypothetical protein